MLVTILEFALVLALAGFFVMWAKWEEKVKTREERDRRWDEISRAVGLEQIAEEYAEEKERYENNMSYADKTVVRLTKQNRDLQERLSALRCPRNDHVWKDGCCVKCGRVKDATASPN